MRAPLVGRTTELDVLITSIDDATRGQGRIVSVTGEAGLGKSRLILEARDAVMRRDTPPTWIVAPALSFERAIPLAVVRRLVRRAVGADESTDDETVWELLDSHVRQVLPGRAAEIGPYLGTAAGAALPADAQARLDYLEGDRLRAEIFRSVIELLEAMATHSPLVLILEDLHWADSSTIDLTTALLDLAERAPLGLILVYRPRRHEPSWDVREAAERDHPHIHRVVALEPLDDAEARTLVSTILDVDGLPEAVRTTVLAKSEGNPFFIEEVIRSMIDRHLVVEEAGRGVASADLVDVAIPDSLSAVITTRLDSLDESAKRVVQSGSVLGREFRYDELAAVLDSAVGIDADLVTLQRRDLVREVSRMPHRVLRFKHALTQEAIYETLLLRNRTEMHARIGRHLAMVKPERAEDIADHFLAARLHSQALPFLIRAGNRALRTHAIPEAISRFRQAVEVVDSAADVPRQLVRESLEGLGRAHEGGFDFQAAMDAYIRLRRTGESWGDLEATLSGQNKAAFLTGMMLQDMDSALSELGMAEEAAREAGTNSSLAETCMYQCYLHTTVGEFEAVEHYMSEMARVGDELGDPETVLFGLTHLANTLALSLKPDDSLREAQHALSLAEANGHLKWQAELLAEVMPLAHLQRNEVDEAMQAAERGMEIAVSIGNRLAEGWAALIRGTVAMARGELEDALGSFRRADAAFTASGLPWVAPLGRCLVASCFERIGGRYVQVALDMQRAALDSVNLPLGQIFGGWVWAEVGHCARSAGNPETAEELFRRALDVPTAGRLLGTPEALRGLSLIAISHGDLDAAASHLSAYQAFVEAHAVPSHQPGLLMTEATIEAAKGNHAEALARLDLCLDSLDGLGFLRLELDVQKERIGSLNALGEASQLDAALSRFDEITATITSKFRDDELRAAFASSVARSVID